MIPCTGNLSPSHVTCDATGRADMCVRVGGDGTHVNLILTASVRCCDRLCCFHSRFVGDFTIVKVSLDLGRIQVAKE